MARREQLELAGRARLSQPSPSHNLGRFQRNGCVVQVWFSRSSTPRSADDRP
jgi:hypothetical protein